MGLVRKGLANVDGFYETILEADHAVRLGGKDRIMGDDDEGLPQLGS